MAHDLRIDTLVAIPSQAVQAPNPPYNAENFTTGKRHKAAAYYFKRYATKAYASCSVKDQCAKATYGKGIHRSEYQEYIQHNKEQVDLNKALYK